MTVSVQSGRVEYAGNGVTTNFSVTFEFNTSADLKVYQNGTLKTVTTHYTVSGGSGSTGTVTFLVAPAATEEVVILDDPAVTQQTDYTPNDPFPAESHEAALDKLTRIVRRLKDQIARSFVLPDSDTSGASTQLPSPEANKLIGWNENGDELQNVNAATLATLVAYGTANADLFDGDGVTTQFTLSANPGALNNLDVSIGGVTQTPGADYNWTSGTTITFTSAPPAGTDNVLVRYMQGLPQGTTVATAVTANDGSSGSIFSDVQGFITKILSSTGSAIVGFVHDGAGAVTRTVQAKLREFASSDDYSTLAQLIDAHGEFKFRPGNYDQGSSIVITKACQIEGYGATYTQAPSSDIRLSVLRKTFSGALFDINGNSDDLTAGGFGIRSLCILQNYGNGTTASGSAIEIIATATERTNWVRLEDLNIETAGGKDDWNYAINIDGSAHSNLIRNVFMTRIRTVGGTHANGGVRLWGVANAFMSNIMCNLANGDIDIGGGSSAIYGSNISCSDLRIGDGSAASNVTIDGQFSTLNIGANATNCVVTGKCDSEPSIAGTNNVFIGYVAALGKVICKTEGSTDYDFRLGSGQLLVRSGVALVGHAQILAIGGQGGYGAGMSFQSPLGGSGTLKEMARWSADGAAAWNDTAANQDAELSGYTTEDGTATKVVKFRVPTGVNLTSCWLYDSNSASLKQVQVGAADSGGVGYRLLRVTN